MLELLFYTGNILFIPWQLQAQRRNLSREDLELEKAREKQNKYGFHIGLRYLQLLRESPSAPPQVKTPDISKPPLPPSPAPPPTQPTPPTASVTQEYGSRVSLRSISGCFSSAKNVNRTIRSVRDSREPVDFSRSVSRYEHTLTKREMDRREQV